MFHVKHILKEGIHELGIEASEGVIDELHTYIKELLKWNEKMNLVSRKLSPEEVVEKLILISLIPHEVLKPGDRVLDFGAGGGIVGIPLAILNSETEVHLAESKKKPVSFLRYIQLVISPEITVIHKFIREEGDLPAYYQYILVRAVDPESVPEGAGDKIIYYGNYEGKKLNVESSIKWEDREVQVLSW